MAAVALLVTIPVVYLIPRGRTSTAFNRLLVAATVLVGFLLAWVAVAMSGTGGSLGSYAIGDTPILPVLIGSVIGALAVNVPLKVFDFFEPAADDLLPEGDEEIPAEQEVEPPEMEQERPSEE